MGTPLLLPDPGDGSATGTIVRWRVREGDVVTVDQVVAEVEFDLATVEIPATTTGRVTRLCAKKGAAVRVGAPLIELS